MTDDVWLEKVGYALKRTRLDLAIGQKQAAQAIGIGYKTLGKIESGERVRQHFDLVEELAEYYGNYLPEPLDVVEMAKKVSLADLERERLSREELQAQQVIDWDRLRLLIFDYLDYRGITRYEFAKSCGLHAPALTNFLNGRTKALTAENMVRVVLKMDSFFELIIKQDKAKELQEA